SQSVNGYPEFDPDLNFFIPSFKKLATIVNPSPSGLLTFLDTHEDAIYDALFGIPTPEFSPDVNQWWDIPADRHSRGANLAFADGHVDHWKWKVPKKSLVKFSPQDVPPEEMADYQRIKNTFRLYKAY